MCQIPFKICGSPWLYFFFIARYIKQPSHVVSSSGVALSREMSNERCVCSRISAAYINFPPPWLWPVFRNRRYRISEIHQDAFPRCPWTLFHVRQRAALPSRARWVLLLNMHRLCTHESVTQQMILCWGTDSIQNSIPARSSCVNLLCVLGVRTASARHASPLHFAAGSHLLSESLQVLSYWTGQGMLRTEGKHPSQLQNPCVHVSKDSSFSAFHLLSKSWPDIPEMMWRRKPAFSGSCKNLIKISPVWSRNLLDRLSVMCHAQTFRGLYQSYCLTLAMKTKLIFPKLLTIPSARLWPYTHSFSCLFSVFSTL